MEFQKMSRDDLSQMKLSLLQKYTEFQEKKLDLDMTRGKPCAEQLNLSDGMLGLVDASNIKASDGTDTRNYGGLDGLPEAKKLFAEFLEVGLDEVIIGGNSSLNLMADVLMQAMISGLSDSDVPWSKLPKVKFLCPSPGYDRHFTILEYLGIEMVPVPMTSEGPDMDLVRKLASEDESVKGIFCVPKYSNPSGITYSDSVVDALASMKTMAKDFVIMWDNAYTVHHLGDNHDKLKNILLACKAAGNPDRVILFGSTSKLTYSGAGVAVLGGSKRNMDTIRKRLTVQTIGPDKVNQLRHCRFFKNKQDIEAHMKKHASIIRSKFDAVLSALDRDLAGKGIADWTKPNGGYFVSLDTMEGCAKTVIEMAAKAGVKLTPAGSSYPYKKDPKDTNIRIAPTFPSTADVKTAMDVFTLCVQIAAIDKLLK